MFRMGIDAREIRNAPVQTVMRKIRTWLPGVLLVDRVNAWTLPVLLYGHFR
jgi:hypothetical protein